VRDNAAAMVLDAPGSEMDKMRDVASQVTEGACSVHALPS
jgi:hypothetical protein